MRTHLTIANVLAGLALFVVLGGPAEAARTVQKVLHAKKADNATRAGGFRVSAQPAPRKLLPLDADGRFPASVLPLSAGIPGPTGPAGAPGPAGPAGADGQLGPAGEAGPQGARGITGAKGDKGDTGPAGPTGDRGPAGAGKGFVWRGAWSAQTAYLADDTTFHEGATYVAKVASTGDEPGTSASWGLMAARGGAGPKGDLGATGADGPSGVAGPVGPAGPAGDTGAKGSTGDTGARGPAGPTGEKGDRGEKGDTGERGPMGANGPTGPKGDTGDAGARGPAGPTGPQGDAGPAGPAGPTGADGRSIMWRGAWNALTSYLPRDAVSYQGSAYIATAVNSGSTPPGSASWNLMAAKGDTGAPGGTGPAGPAGADGKSFVYRGTWSSSTAYVAGDVVFADGSSYVARTSGTNQAPLTNPAAWGLMAVEGAVGPAGPRGLAGPTGPEGPAGPAGSRGPAAPTGPDGAAGPIGPTGPSGLAVGNGRSVDHSPNPLLTSTPQVAIDTTITIPQPAILFVQSDVEVVKDGTTNSTSAQPVCRPDVAPFGTTTWTAIGGTSQEDIGTPNHRRQILVTGSGSFAAGRYTVRVTCTGNNSYIDDANISAWAVKASP